MTLWFWLFRIIRLVERTWRIIICFEYVIPSQRPEAWINIVCTMHRSTAQCPGQSSLNLIVLILAFLGGRIFLHVFVRRPGFSQNLYEFHARVYKLFVNCERILYTSKLSVPLVEWSLVLNPGICMKYRVPPGPVINLQNVRRFSICAEALKPVTSAGRTTMEAATALDYCPP